MTDNRIWWLGIAVVAALMIIYLASENLKPQNSIVVVGKNPKTGEVVFQSEPISLDKYMQTQALIGSDVDYTELKYEVQLKS